jgi:hypothetical protein
MINILMSTLAVFFPWMVLLIHDNPGGALVSLIMQATIIGWPFATLWAWQVIHKSNKPKN